MHKKGELKLIKHCSWISNENTQVTQTETKERRTRTAQSCATTHVDLQGGKEEMLLYIARREGQEESSYVSSNVEIIHRKAKIPLSLWPARNHKSHMSKVMSPDRKLLIVWISGWPKVNPALSEPCITSFAQRSHIVLQALRFERWSTTGCRVINKLVP